MRQLVRSSVAIGLVVGAAFGPALFWAIHHDKYPLSVAVFAIDDFGNYIHFTGHLAAEKLIQEIAAVVKGVAGGSSILARSGDDEFIVLLRG